MFRISRNKRKDAAQAYLMLLPAAVLLVLFMLWPMLNSAFYGLFKWNLVGDKTFIGLENFKFMFFQDESFRRALLNTLVYTVVNMVLTLVLSLGCALLFQRESKLSVVGRCACFIPVVVPITVMGMVWTWHSGTAMAVRLKSGADRGNHIQCLERVWFIHHYFYWRLAENTEGVI